MDRNDLKVKRLFYTLRTRKWQQLYDKTCARNDDAFCIWGERRTKND